MYVSCHTRICSHSWNGERKEKYLFNMHGWAGPAPCPLPPAPLAELWGGGGLAGRVLPPHFEQERGISGKQAASWNGRFFWQVNSADYSRGWILQASMARYFGAFIWRIILAHLFGGFSQSMKQASFKAKEEKKKKCTISRSVSCIMSLYIASDIMLFCSRYRFYWTS